ncbi:MAG TPA: WD40 repeat domain-containing serine/threonine protein kinase [Thermoanaerobaculia bacterium]|jgi:Tol biopolymer transport system component|nr:WD40 repeat domain-containing serine/threonine protein kinase [Thermoanaerobaculia bacterium]
MTLVTGARLGPYEILSPLGAGGMGEVYRARDARLNRDVAVKILPERVAGDAHALGRFEREAKAVAALSDPHILSIFDFGTSDGVAYAVMELLDGQTLRETLEGGALAPRRAAGIAREIAEGLAAAHGKGIVHRDLKPDNVFVTRSGHVKILDFGLAMETAEKDDGDTSAPTERRLTEPGTVMGTAGYMSPEQVRGKALDHRSDVFSFGTILYEMLAGRRAFSKPTAAETMTAILNEDPPEIVELSALASSLELVARRCLEKDPAARFQDTRDVAFAVEMASDGFRSSGAEPAIASKSAALPRWIAIGLAIGGAALGGWLLARRSHRVEPPRFERVTYRRGYVRGARFGPDGRAIVYAAAWDGGPLKLFLKQPEAPDALALELPSANLLAVSAAGELAIALACQASFAGTCVGTLARVPLTGGSPREVALDVQQADFARDGSLAVVRNLPRERKSRLEFPIGKVLYETSGHVSCPRVSPDGRTVAFFDHPVRGDDQGFVALVDLTGKKKILSKHFDSLRGLAWSASGDEIWFTGADVELRALYGVRPSGGLRTIYRAPGKLALADVSREGKVLLALEDERNGVMGLGPGDRVERDLAWLDLSSIMDMSNDGRLLLLTEQSEAVGSDNVLAVRKMDGSPPIRLGGGVGLISPDSSKVAAIVFGSKAAAKVLPIGAGDPVTLPTEGLEAAGMAWFHDSRRLLFTGSQQGQPPRFLLIDTTSGSKQTIAFDGAAFVADISPDSTRALAYRTDGSWALYPIGGGAPVPIPGVGPDDTSFKFVDDRTLFVAANGRLPVEVYRLDLTTGKKTLFRSFEPSDKAGVSYVRNAVLSLDGSAYAYQYRRWLTNLFVASGLR